MKRLTPMQNPASGSAHSAANKPFTPPDALALFSGFTQITMSGFGGVLPFAYRGLVEKRGWLTAQEFAELLGMSQVLPGPSICNLAMMLGLRYAGLRGAIAALTGILAGPFVILIFLGMIYERYGSLGPFRAALLGMSAVAAGLIAGTAMKMALPMIKERSGRKVNLVLTVLAFVGLGLVQLPMIAVVAILAPIGIGFFYWKKS